MDKLLLVSGDESLAEDLSEKLKGQFIIVASSQGRRALDILRTDMISSVLLDRQLVDMNAAELLPAIRREISSHIPVIFLFDLADVESAVEFMHLGADDISPRNVNVQLLLEKLRRARAYHTREISFTALQHSVVTHHDQMVLASAVMKKTNFEISRLAKLDFDVLLIGETGVGKDLAASEIHTRSNRAGKPFIPVPIRSLSDTLIESELFGHEKGAFSGADKPRIGKLEASNGGTVYIPEISSLTEEVQLKLLQFMQYKTITRVGQDARKPEIQLDVRIIMATNEKLEDLVKNGRMREDFFHRITGVRLRIPPLRERVGAHGQIAKYFLGKYTHADSGETYKLSAEVDALESYPWPGNIRELKNAVKSALAYAANPMLTLQDFPMLTMHAEPVDICAICMSTKFPTIKDFKTAGVDFMRAYFREVMKRAGSNIAKAAEIAGMTPQGFRKKLLALDIKEPAA